jgi:carbonic anhydrase/acetyltransferase-like protein (isoleucine patch superfamily)
MSLFTKTPGNYYVARNATIVGDVRIGELCSFWFGAVVRGDVAPVTLGRRVNVQDNCVIHSDTDVPNVIEDDVTIGHGAIVHGEFVGRGSLIGMGSTVLSRTKIGRGCLIGAGSVLPQGMEVPDDMVVIGVPGKVVRPVNAEDREYMNWLTGYYVELAQKHVDGAFTSGGSMVS